ncbi:MAG: hypothetical protein M1821_005350 [Bathelium mastoideum]|nr:MAG: hypothetical protein M1821_005350 [Bathelium mastoideum]
MPPDLNSLPPSRSPSGSSSPLQLRPTQNSAENPRGSSSPHSPLAATASVNVAGLGQDSRRSSRRRSSLMTNLNLNDPTSTDPQSQLPVSSTASLSRSPVPMATADPHHHRAPSLGELHQELEAEQEAQVNRLLHMIRQQQAQLETLQRSNHSVGNAAVDDSTPTSERSFSIPAATAQAVTTTTTSSSIPHRTSHEHSRRPSLSRQSSRRSHVSVNGSSHTASPALPPVSAGLPRPHPESGEIGGGDFVLGSAPARERDESAFYQAETQMLTRENQMLKQRIRELERQIAEMATGSSTPHTLGRTPSLDLRRLGGPSPSGGTTERNTVEGDGETKTE